MESPFSWRQCRRRHFISYLVYQFDKRWKRIARNRLLMESEINCGLTWSLHPLFYAMRIFGINLDFSFNTYRDILIKLVSSSSFLVLDCLLFSQLGSLYEKSANGTSANAWITFFKKIAAFISLNGYLLAVIEMATLVKWKPLLEALHKMSNHDDTFKLQLRKLSVSLTIFTIILVS